MAELKQPITPLSRISVPSSMALSLDDAEAEEQKKPYQIERQLDELYAQAKIANRKLGRFINQVSREFKGAVGGINTAPLKERSTAKAKLTRGGPGSREVEDLKDIARATLMFNSIESMYAARDYIKNQSCFTVFGNVALKDRYLSKKQGGAGATAQGYRDVKFFLGMDVGRGRNHIVELQLNLKSTLKGKDVGHPFYDVVRLGGDAWDPRLPDSAIRIPADKVHKLGRKLLHACHECISRDIETASARRVKEMVKRKFYKPVFATFKTASGGSRPMYSDNKSRTKVIDHYEPRNNSIHLYFNTTDQIETGDALSRVSSAAYAYYKKQSRQYAMTNSSDMHKWW
ncbi:MAG: hypothetical protein V7731_13120 [Amphritea sp.]